MKRTLIVIGVIVGFLALMMGVVVAAQSGGGATSGQYSAQTVTKFGETTQVFAPQKELAKSEFVITLPGGNPETPWQAQNSGCWAFALNQDNPPLPTGVIMAGGDGAQFLPGMRFSISCPPGGRIWWERTLPKVQLTAVPVP